MMAMNSECIAIRAKSLVLPEKLSCKTQDHTTEIYTLSRLDHRFTSPEQNFHLIFFYQHPHSLSFHANSASQQKEVRDDAVAEFMESLKQSLAIVLNLYPVVAGRFRAAEKQQGELEIVLRPGSEHGMVFIEATAEARLDDWPDLRKCWLLMQLVKPLEVPGKSTENTPLAQVQVTVFKCGGVSLGLSFAHLLTDGKGATKFIQAWGEIHQNQRPSISPTLSRKLIHASECPHLTEAITRNNSSFLKLPPPTEQEDPNISTHTRVLTLRVSDEKVNECVREVEQGPYSYGRATAFEAVCALVWSSLARARGWNSEDEESSFYFPVDIRRRLEPPLPAGYFGNAILFARTVGNAKLVATLHFSYAAMLIQEAVKRHTPGFCQSAIDEMELQLKNGGSLQSCEGVEAKSGYGCTSFEKFPVYSVNFGWGTPLHVAFVYLPPASSQHTYRPIGGVLIMPTPEGGMSRDLSIGSPRSSEMDALLNDPLLQRFRDPKSDIVF